MTEPVTLTCPDCGHEFPVHIAYGDPDDEPGPSTLTDGWEYHE